MRFYEFEAKEVLASAGIPIPKSIFCRTAEEVLSAANEIEGSVVLKSQVLSGGRMKVGGIRF
ncbi:MAG TPA: succinate--CoA ligase subunit beta, partial [Dehalococcoidia bacterium]|nr:succinate--CoA ligase subunit beta [Dehalococcoidia bacterium]